MINEKQRHEIAERLTIELPDVDDAQTLEIGSLVYTLAAIETGHDIDFLLTAINPDSGRDEHIRRAANICLEELAKNNYSISKY
jgi:hypothetical protein